MKEKRKPMAPWLLLCIAAFTARGSAQDRSAWMNDRQHLFRTVSSAHFDVHYIPDPFIESRIDTIIARRERSYHRISLFLDIKAVHRVRIYLFPDETLKYTVTGHRGAGWGFDSTIVEVYSDSVSVDPYHELTHILIYTFSKPAVMLDEGLAVYLSERFGSNALAGMLGYSGMEVNGILRLLRKERRLLPVRDLLTISAISEAGDPVMTYLQSASLTAYLIEKFGKESLLRILRMTGASDTEGTADALMSVCGLTPEMLESAWLRHLLQDELRE